VPDRPPAPLRRTARRGAAPVVLGALVAVAAIAGPAAAGVRADGSPVPPVPTTVAPAGSGSSGSGSSGSGATSAGVPTAAQPTDPAPTLPEPAPSTADADARADQILSGEEYRPPEPNWFDRAWEWIKDRIEDLLRRLDLDRGAPGEAGASKVVAWVVIALLVGLAIFLIVRARARRRPRDEAMDDPVYVSEVEARRTADEWLVQAARHEDAGEWKAALRCRYRALIVELIEHDVVRDLPGRTSGEFRLEVRRRAPALDAPFTTASGLFDEAFYGDLPTGPAESVRFQEAAGAIVGGLGRSSLVDAAVPSGFVAPGADG